MKVSEQIAIMKAYADGKTIERKGQDDTEWQSIEYIEDYPFDFFCEKYRIKIKQENKYRPLESVEEAFEEAKKHGFWVKEKSSGFLVLIDSFSEDYSVVYIIGNKAAELLDYFVWVDDGSPCGIKI